MNPIFIEYYSHEQSQCYKIKNPWTKYGSETQVLCRVDQGIELAKILAVGVLNHCLNEALQKEIT
jgi:hypothetical protein